ncbi:MAG: hypothetical protein ACI4UW_01790 [Muribaculaceae bacterium]
MSQNRTKKFKRSTFLPLALLVYLSFMAYIGRGYLLSGDYLYYFGILTGSLLVIILLHFSLKRKEAMQEKRNNENEYGTYDDDVQGDIRPDNKD